MKLELTLEEFLSWDIDLFPEPLTEEQKNVISQIISYYNNEIKNYNNVYIDNGSPVYIFCKIYLKYGETLNYQELMKDYLKTYNDLLFSHEHEIKKSYTVLDWEAKMLSLQRDNFRKKHNIKIKWGDWDEEDI